MDKAFKIGEKRTPTGPNRRRLSDSILFEEDCGGTDAEEQTSGTANFLSCLDFIVGILLIRPVTGGQSGLCRERNRSSPGSPSQPRIPRLSSEQE